MARTRDRLSAVKIQGLKNPGYYADGGNLYFRVADGGTKAWVRFDDGREDPHAAGERVTRGGDYAYQSASEHLVTWHRRGFSRQPASGHRHIGFRCAAGE